jgi:hypothetical protein
LWCWLAPFLLAFGPASQQAPTGLQTLEVALWPEFDRPAVLVIYRFALPPDTALPASLALPIPPELRELNALAYVGPDGQLLNIPNYAIEDAAGRGLVRFSMPGQQGQLEYYADLVRAGDQRSFRFDWLGGIELASFGFEVQQPPTATSFSVIPEPNSQSVEQDGLVHYFGSLQPSGPDWTASIELTYQKADDLLSADSLEGQQPALGQPAPPPGGLDLQAGLPWLLGGLGAVLVAGGVIWYLRLSRPAPAPAQGRPSRRRRRAGAEIEASPIYCHNCGTRAGPSDVFCRQCGTKLRRG